MSGGGDCEAEGEADGEGDDVTGPGAIAPSVLPTLRHRQPRKKKTLWTQ